jgi:hypothetical protein
MFLFLIVEQGVVVGMNFMYNVQTEFRENRSVFHRLKWGSTEAAG